MTRRFNKAAIRPQISTMPRQQTEASAHLHIYRLLVEKNRLQQELQSIEQRRQQINEHLLALEGQVANLEKTAQELHNPSPKLHQSNVTDYSKSFPGNETFDTLFLEY